MLEAVVRIDTVWLALVAVFSIIGKFYYVRFVKLIPFDKVATDAPGH